MASSDTCPVWCMLGAGCYARYLQYRGWARVASDGVGWTDFLRRLESIPRRPGSLLRLWVAGDFPGDRETLDPVACEDLVTACAGLTTWGYTHYRPVGARTLRGLSVLRAGGIAVRCTGERIASVAEWYRDGIPSALVTDSSLESLPFPAHECKGLCVECRHCLSLGDGGGHRVDTPVVVFRPHGPGARAARAACLHANS